MPITKELLHKVIAILPSFCSSQYETKLFKAAFSLAYHGLLRVSEFACVQGDNSHVLSYKDVIIRENLLQVFVSSSKTDQFGRGTLINIHRQLDIHTCPYFLIQEFAKVRPLLQGVLFCHFDGRPITRTQVVAVLKKALSCIGVNHQGYSSHSFRIGAATSLSMLGFSDNMIMQAGRWKSDAYKSYLRSPHGLN